ncbi:NAD(P)-dependent oxidoreductase [Herbidospora cretacea]|uniref:NAD(P)-dependent oxidoreductase n=1 Tax=Herbidospora cretacea TaxID=28444 RepID=UPI0007C68365|nr:NAD(P)-dependent oxidoreductase [Herbidospora cretacea]
MNEEHVGFAGLGLMGLPMALNLARAGVPLVVWNRTPGRCAPVAEAGGLVAASPSELFGRCATVLLMLADETAIDAVLDGVDVHGRTVVQMGTIAPAASVRLAERVTAGGGCYVEAPVSGSRGPAEAGELVFLLSGPPGAATRAAGLLGPMGRAWFDCGPVPGALTTKLAVNLFLITMVTGLAEAFHFAEEHGLDPALVERVLDAGPMASAVSRAKAAKIVAADFTPQAAIGDVLKNARLVAEAAAGIGSPLIDACHGLFRETLDLGHGAADMAAVIEALRARTSGRSTLADWTDDVGDTVVGTGAAAAAG